MQPTTPPPLHSYHYGWDTLTSCLSWMMARGCLIFSNQSLESPPVSRMIWSVSFHHNAGQCCIHVSHIHGFFKHQSNKLRSPIKWCRPFTLLEKPWRMDRHLACSFPAPIILKTASGHWSGFFWRLCIISPILKMKQFQNVSKHPPCTGICVLVFVFSLTELVTPSTMWHQVGLSGILNTFPAHEVIHNKKAGLIIQRLF